MQEDDEAIYISKCANHIRPRISPTHTHCAQGKNDLQEAAEASGGYTSDEDNNSVLKKWPEASASSCSIKTRIRCRRGHKQSRSFRIKHNPSLNNLDKIEFQVPTNYNPLDLSESTDTVENTEESKLITLAGGPDLALKVLKELEENIFHHPLKLEPSGVGQKDTALMQKCCKTPTDSLIWQKIYGQIWAYIKLMSRHKPDLLVYRNAQDVSALDLAALTNKPIVCQFLARTLEHHGFDPNAGNRKGHTVLHLLARKGDDCSETLETLLAVKKMSNPNQRLFQIDVVNQGHKTPLDVAVACSHLFSTGENRAIYTNTINLFHDVIIAEADSLMEENDNEISD